MATTDAAASVRLRWRDVFGSAILALTASSAAGWAAEPRFALPIDCTIGEVCVVQNYVDVDPGSSAGDFACGSLSYDGHSGTDFRLPDYVAMRRGIAVIAAAPGEVIGLRDDMPDISVAELGAAALDGRDAGNGVLVDHGNGWQSQYSHLKRGSVAVRLGQRVETGTRLGQVGLSGNTEFPHLDFRVLHDGVAVDPFTGLAIGSGCGAEGASLWREDVRALLAYRPGGLLDSGFSSRTPSVERVLEGHYRGAHLSRDSPALVFWTLSWGLRQGDRETFRLTGPGGDTIAAGSAVLARDEAQWLRFVGKRRGEAPWAGGTYRAHYRIERRDGATTRIIVEASRDLEIR